MARASTGAGTSSPPLGVSAIESSPSTPGVRSTSAGYTRWNETPLPQCSVASASKYVESAAFAAAYADSPGDDTQAAMDDTTTTWPDARSSMLGSTARVRRTGDK